MFFHPDRGEEPVGRADWDRVMDVVSDLMTEVEDLYPIRYRVSEFPTVEQFERMGLE